MEDLENELSQFSFTQPPPWLKARAAVAVQNALAREYRKKRIKTLIMVAVAAALVVAVFGRYVLSILAPVARRNPSALKAAPMAPLPGADELLDSAAGAKAAIQSVGEELTSSPQPAPTAKPADAKTAPATKKPAAKKPAAEETPSEESSPSDAKALQE